MAKQLTDEYMELIRTAKQKKKKNEVLYPLYQRSNELLKEIRTTHELRLDSCLVSEIIGEESKRIFLQCNNHITLNNYIEMASTNTGIHTQLAKSYYRGAYFPPILTLTGSIAEQPIKKPKKPKLEKAQEKPEEVKEVKEEQMDAPKEIKRVYRILKEIGEVELYRLIINVDSFGKTVENILTLAFALKVGRAFLMKKQNILYVSSTKPKEEYAVNSTHYIMGITSAEIDRIKEEMNITENMI
ncbi:non-structural maintenance of chromosomes element 4 [Nematocida parisii]|nr:non-structural maintenance of chromosomes element 4 [Nematocida parisii]KAI5142674.1 non-structural maintenance of chromosomes element 4 [Nematocida parisii]